MLRAYKIEIKLTKSQITRIHETIGVCRYIYNFYLANNEEVYEKEKKFVTGMNFSKWLNNIYIPNNQHKNWIKSISLKAVKQAIMNGEKAFKKFFEGESKFPRFKKNKDVKVYFPKNNKTDWTIQRHRVKVPTLGWIRLKEFAYIPLNFVVKSGVVSEKANKYYVSILVEENINNNIDLKYSEGIGIDLGIKDTAICSNGKVYKNINKTKKVKKLKKSLKRQQRKLSRKYENLKIRNKKEGGNATRQNIQKQVVKVQILHQKLTNIRTDYINKIVSELVKTKPIHITIEDLNASYNLRDAKIYKIAWLSYCRYVPWLEGNLSL